MSGGNLPVCPVDSIGNGAWNNIPAVPILTGRGKRRLGWPERLAFAAGFGVLVHGVGGERILNFLQQRTTVSGVFTASQYEYQSLEQMLAGASCVINQAGTNDAVDMPSTYTLAQVQARFVAFWRAAGGSRGISTWQATLLPRPTSSTDNWISVANQTLATWSASLTLLYLWMMDGAPFDVTTGQAVAVAATGANIARCRVYSFGSAWAATVPTTALLDSRHPLALGGIFDITPAVETSPGSGLWKVGWTGTGNVTNGSTAITSVATVTGTFSNGDAYGNPYILRGTGVPTSPGETTATKSGTTVTLSQAYTGSTASAVAIGQPYVNEGTHPLDLATDVIVAYLMNAGSGVQSMGQILAAAGAN